MSELSAISSQYNTIVNTTDKVNNSIIALKKRSVAKSPLKEGARIYLSAEELQFAKEYLISFLTYLQHMEESSSEMEFLPKAVVKDFQKRIVNTVAFFEDEVRKLLKDINEDQELQKEQFNLLDKMAATLDSERTVLFRKLRTARG